MRRFHNPRYAPESLERKLSPSGVAPVPVAAHIYVPVTQTHAAPHVAPIVIPSHTIASTTATKSLSAAFFGGPSAPQPTEPAVPTGPTLPPGDGNPPDNTPSIPGGPPDPSY